jgi:hypothetical protein
MRQSPLRIRATRQHVSFPSILPFEGHPVALVALPIKEFGGAGGAVALPTGEGQARTGTEDVLALAIDHLRVRRRELHRDGTRLTGRRPTGVPPEGVDPLVDDIMDGLEDEGYFN